MYTTHGHHISGTSMDEPPKAVARCGGPLLCQTCAFEAGSATQPVPASGRTRVKLAVYVDLDLTPGLMHSADSVRNVLSGLLGGVASPYNPMVSIESYDTGREPENTTLYVTSRNSSTSWSAPDCLRVMYLGSSLDDAVEAVGDFQKYQNDDYINRFKDANPQASLEGYSALPRAMDGRSSVHFYIADGYWFHIEKIENWR